MLYLTQQSSLKAKIYFLSCALDFQKRLKTSPPPPSYAQSNFFHVLQRCNLHVVMGLQNFHIVQTSVFHVPKTSGLSYFFHVSKATHHKQGREKNGEEKRKNWAGESWAPPPRLCGKREEEGASPLLLLFSFILSPFFFFALSVFPPLPLLPLRIHLPTSHSRISPPGKKTSG